MVFAGKTLKIKVFARHLHLLNVHGLVNVVKYAINGVFGFGIPGKPTACSRTCAGTIELAQFAHGLSVEKWKRQGVILDPCERQYFLLTPLKYQRIDTLHIPSQPALLKMMFIFTRWDMWLFLRGYPKWLKIFESFLIHFPKFMWKISGCVDALMVFVADPVLSPNAMN